MENIQIENESNDHQYFTIIPNFILNHSTATAQALYLQLKRLAGEGGVAYPASRYLREKLGVSQPTLRKEFGYLLEKGWIKFVGEKDVKTDGGIQKIKAYKIIDLWQLNTDYYRSRGEKIETPSTQRGEKIETQGVKARGEKIGTKEEPLEEYPSSNKKDYVAETATDIPKFDFIGKLQEMEKDKRRHIRIISFYWREKKFVFENEKQYRAALERDLRPASKLTGYETERIVKVVEWLKKQFESAWKLETIHKYIDEPDLSKAELVKKKKPFYKGMPMQKFYGRWKVLDGGEWKEYNDKEALIEFK